MLVRLNGLIRMGLNQFESLPQILDSALALVRKIATAKRHLHATMPRSPRGLLNEQQRVAAILAKLNGIPTHAAHTKWFAHNNFIAAQQNIRWQKEANQRHKHAHQSERAPHPIARGEQHGAGQKQDQRTGQQARKWPFARWPAAPLLRQIFWGEVDHFDQAHS